MAAASNNKHFVVKYFECRHNYAARSMGHVLDGCGEFCPTGPPDTPQSFICAACHCHRNFHRKVEVEVEVEDGVQLHPTNGAPLVIIDGPPDRAQVGDETFENNNGDDSEKEIEGGEMKRKYTISCSERMKLNPYQRERVLVFAQNIMGWKWSKYNEQVIPFCAEIGITPLFLKNWINNNRRRIGPLKKNI